MSAPPPHDPSAQDDPVWPAPAGPRPPGGGYPRPQAGTAGPHGALPPYGRPPQTPYRPPGQPYHPVTGHQQPYNYQPVAQHQWGPPAPPPRRRSPARTVLVVLLVLVLAGSITGFVAYRLSEARKEREAEALASAQQAYSLSADDLDLALDSLVRSQRVLDDATTEATDLVASATTLLDGASAGVLPEADTAAAGASRSELQSLVDSWAPPAEELPSPAPAAPAVGDDVPAATQETRDRTAEIEDDIAVVHQLDDAYTAQAEALSTASDAVEGDAGTLLSAVPTTTQAFLDGNPLATNKAKTDMQWAALAVVPSLGPDSGSQVSAFVSSAQAVVTSQADRTYLRDNPVHPVRATVEEFALGLANGVPIDFEWERIVNGYGANGTSGGTSTWSTGQFRFSTMTLSNNIADLWPGESVKALVAHETGHSILNKDSCYALFEAPPFSGDYEAFATAWAISMGFDDHNGSGEWAYGRPTDEQIAVAGQCR